MCQLRAGDHLVSSAALFGSCKEIVKNILPRYGIEDEELNFIYFLTLIKFIILYKIQSL